MSIITLADALQHLRLVSTYPAGQVQPYLDAAEHAAQDFLNRRVFAEPADLVAALADLPATLSAAASARDAALEATESIADCDAAHRMRTAALTSYLEALQAAEAVARGVVINPAIRAGMLLTLSHLFGNRSAVVAGTTVAEVPQGAISLLRPHRAGWGG